MLSVVSSYFGKRWEKRLHRIIARINYQSHSSDSDRNQNETLLETNKYYKELCYYGRLTSQIQPWKQPILIIDLNRTQLFPLVIDDKFSCQ